MAIPLEARSKPAGAGCPWPAEVMEAQPLSRTRGRSRGRYWKQVCCPAGRWEPLGRKPLKEIYVRLSSPLSPETNYTPVLPRSGGPARLCPLQAPAGCPSTAGASGREKKMGSAVESGPAPLAAPNSSPWESGGRIPQHLGCHPSPAAPWQPHAASEWGARRGDKATPQQQRFPRGLLLHKCEFQNRHLGSSCWELTPSLPLGSCARGVGAWLESGHP